MIVRHTVSTLRQEKDTVMISWVNVGFWSTEQCDLWNLIETGTKIDMVPYLASIISEEEKWWSHTTPTDQPGSGTNGRIIYHLHLHLHLHKAAGTSFCSWFKEARQLSGSGVGRTTNPKNNCNVPEKWWMDKNKTELGFQMEHTI